MIKTLTQKKLSQFSLFKIPFNGITYDIVVQAIIENALIRKSFGVTSLAVHGLITAKQKIEVKEAVYKINIVTPDGQPIRWALNFFYDLKLKTRVSGPDLVIKVLEKANELGLNIFLYGSTKETLIKLSKFVETKFPNVKIVGLHEDRFREASPEEDLQDIKKINDSNAHIVFIGRGCPRQEIWVANHLDKINASMLAVGAAFDFHAGILKKAPQWMENSGLEWLYRLMQEPKRLWKRYLITNTLFIFYILKEIFKKKLSNKN